MKKVVHIVPTLPPAINGLGDFCKILANNLARDQSVKNVFMVANGPPGKTWPDIHVFNSSTFLDVLAGQAPDVVILQYVGYAYNKYALPFYLVRGLERCKQQYKFKLLVFFHELYSSSGSLLKLPFYTQGLQRSIVRGLLDIADKAFTNCSQYKEILNMMVADRQRSENLIECTGIFSNIPEDLINPSAAKDDGTLVVFGSAVRRRAVYANGSFPDLLKALRIRVVYDIGPGDICFESSSVTVERTGALQPEQLAQYLNKTKYGALSYKPELLAKSGIFSAYAAFGIIPVNVLESGKPLCDNLIEGKNCFNIKTIAAIMNDSEPVKHVMAWYKTRNQQTVASRIKVHLENE